MPALPKQTGRNVDLTNKTPAEPDETMTITSFILAADDRFVPLAFFALVAFFWVMRVISSLAGGKKQQVPRQPQRAPWQAQRPVNVGRPGGPRPGAAAPPRRIMPRAVPGRLAAGASPLPPLSSLARSGVPPRVAPKPNSTRAAVPFPPQAITAPAPTAAATKAPAPVTSRAMIGRWLTRGTLRSQFILSEALQPPLSLRKSHLP